MGQPLTWGQFLTTCRRKMKSPLALLFICFVVGLDEVLSKPVNDQHLYVNINRGGQGAKPPPAPIVPAPVVPVPPPPPPPAPKPVAPAPVAEPPKPDESADTDDDDDSEPSGEDPDANGDGKNEGPTVHNIADLINQNTGKQGSTCQQALEEFMTNAKAEPDKVFSPKIKKIMEKCNQRRF